MEESLSLVNIYERDYFLPLRLKPFARMRVYILYLYGKRKERSE